jgi:hypothetical protein
MTFYLSLAVYILAVLYVVHVIPGFLRMRAEVATRAKERDRALTVVSLLVGELASISKDLPHDPEAAKERLDSVLTAVVIPRLKKTIDGE